MPVLSVQNSRIVLLSPISRRVGSSAYFLSCGIAPTEQNVRSHKYPIWRYLYYYTNGRPSGELARYINWTLSEEGQKIVEEVGYYSLK